MIVLFLVFFNLNFVVGDPYINKDCSDGEIRKVWESIFKESYDGASISKVEDREEECYYYIYKSSSGENYILIGNSLVTINKKTILRAIYVNGSIEGGLINEGVSEDELLEFGAGRNLSLVEAEDEFNRIFRGADSGEWVLTTGGPVSDYFELIGSSSGEEIRKKVYNRKVVNSLYYALTETIPSEDEAEDNFGFKEIGSIYVPRGEEFKLNLKIFLKDPGIDGLKYRVVGLKNTSIKFSKDIMTIKWDKNYDGFEEVRIYADNGTKEVRSNAFLIFYIEEDGSVDEKNEKIEASKEESEKPFAEELNKETKSFNWVVFAVIISCILVLIMVVGLVYVLFAKKGAPKEEFRSEEVDEYIKELKMD